MIHLEMCSMILRLDSTNDAETSVDMEKSTSKVDIEIIYVEEEHSEEVSNMVAPEERIVELDEGQAGSDSSKMLESQPPPKRVLMKEDQAGSNPRQSHVSQAGPNPKPIHEDFIAIVYPYVHESLKLTTEEQVHIENPSSLFGTLSSMKNLEDALTLEPIITATTATTTPLPPPPLLAQSTIDSDLATYVSALEKRREAPSSSSKKKLASPSVQHVDDNLIPKDMHLSELEDTSAAHLLKIKTRLDWLKPVPEEDIPETLEPDWVIPLNDLPKTKNNWADALIGKTKLVKANLEDQIDLINPEGNRVMHDLSKPLPLRGPPGQVTIQAQYFFNKDLEYLVSEVVLQRADYKEYKISEADFKNLHPNDFKHMCLLHLQGKLNHLSEADKVYLSTAVNLWTKYIVIKKCVKDLQLGIESYQTKLHITELSWDATDFLFKEDFTIVHKPRAAIYKDRNN
nr:hypothetical protein [Tanacetum cinerariifolium]